MIRARTRSCGALLAVLWWFVSGALGFDEHSAWAREPVSTEAQLDDAKFRRVFVPADSPQTWPIGADRYLPVANSTFARLTRIQSQQSSESSHVAVGIQRGVYRAELRSAATLEIEAELDVNTLGGESQLLPISPLNMAIQSANWKEPSERRAVAGLWEQDGAKMTPAILVERPGVLMIEGLLPASEVTDDHVEFLFKAPSIVPATFELVLPAAYSVEISNAELLKTESAMSGAGRWLFQLAPHEVHRITVRQVRETREDRRPPLGSQLTHYDIDSTGIEFVTELLTDGLQATNTTARAELPAGTRVIDVTRDQEGVEWSVVTDEGRQHLVVALSEADSPQLVRIHCLAKLRMDSLWELPKLRFETIAWTEGTSRLLISPDLELQSLNPIQCTLQHIVGITTDTNEGEVYRFQEWSQEAALEVRVTRPQTQLEVQTLTQVELASGEAQGTVVADFANSRGAVYQTRAVIHPGWQVNSVTSSPESALREWHVNRTDASSILHCQLDRPVSAEHPVQIRIEARNTTGQLQLPTAVGRFRVLRFLEAIPTAEWLNLSTAKSEQIVLAHESTSSLTNPSAGTTDIPTGLLDAMPERTGSQFIEISRLRDADRIEIGQQPARYSARVQVAIDAEPDQISHTYKLDYFMEAGAISELILESSVPVPESMQWIVADKNVQVTTRRVVTANAVDSDNLSTEKYLLKFSERLESDFQLQASYSQPIGSLQLCNLLRLTDTHRWTEQVQVHGALEDFELIDQGLTPSLTSTLGVNSDSLPLLGAYRISPQEFRREANPVNLYLKRRTTPHLIPKLVAWVGEYQTVQAADGAALHAANYMLENSGERVAFLKLPGDAELQDIWLNTQRIDTNRSRSADNTYKFSFNGPNRWHRLSLRYSTRTTALGGSAKIQPVLPECSFPVNLGRWTLWAPEQYEIDNALQRYSPQRYHWWKRLFGPLARPRGEARFKPFSRTAWTTLWSTPLAVQNSRQLTGSLANQLSERIPKEPERPFGAILAELVDQNRLESLFCIDRTAVLASGLQANTLCGSLAESQPDPSSMISRARPLSSYQLALISSPKAIVLSTAERVAHWRDQIRPTRVSGVYLVTADELADRLAELRGSRSPDYVSVVDWLGIPPPTEVLWDASDRTSLADVGRQAQSVEFSKSVPTLVVRQAYVSRAVWYAVLLLSLVIGLWKIGHFPNCMLLIGAVTAAACLVVPPHLLTIPQAIFLGLVAAALVRVVLSSTEVGSTPHSATEKLATCLVAFVIVQAGPVGDVVAQSPTVISEMGTQVESLPKVLIPIDSEGMQQGEDVYLPERFLKALQGFNDQQPTAVGRAVILAAQYDANLQTNSVDSMSSEAAAAARPWTLRWKLETSVPDLELFLPLRQEEAIWIADAHQLDGLPVKLNWHPNDGGCSIVIPERGVHWLNLACRPRYSGTNGAKRLQLHVPAVPEARLELTYPAADVDVLRVPGAALLTEQSTPSAKQYLLGLQEKIEIHWENDSSIKEVEFWERLEQSSWLFVDGAAARLEVQFHFVGRRGSSQELSLEFSDELKFIDQQPNLQVAEVLEADPMYPRRVRLRLGADVPSDFVLPLQFELKRSVSIGKIYFPEVRVVGSSPELNRFAVSVSSGLSYDERGSGDLRGLEPREFLESWDDPGGAPLFAYALDRQSPAWSLMVWPDPYSLDARQALRMHCSSKSVDVEFEAEVHALTGSWHSHRLLIPDSIQIDEILVIEKNESRSVPLRWSRSSPTEVSVFLSTPVERPQRVSIRGRLIVAANGQFEVPQIRLAYVNRGEIRMELYRTEDIDLSWVSPVLAPQQNQDQTIPRSADELHVGSFSWRANEADSLSELRIRKNQVAFGAESVTTIEPAADGWRSGVSSRILVGRGVLSRLRLDVPPTVRAPFQLTPEHAGVIGEVVESTAGKQITVLLAEPAAAGDEIKIGLSGKLDLPVDQRLVVPSLRWSGASRSERYVLLPTLVDAESIAWHRSGLRRQSLPLRLVEFATQEAPAHCFRIEQELFEAEQRNAQRVMRRARVRHAKITGLLDTKGDFSATAEFLLQPGRASSCTVQLPRNSEVLQLVVGDAPARRVRLSDGSWKLPIGPPFLPQRILLSYRCNMLQTSNRLTLDPPKILLGDQVLPAEKTWWRIRTPVELSLHTDETKHRTSAREIARTSYEVPLQIVQDAFSQALDLPQEEGRAWTRTWRGIIRRAEREWQAFGSWNDEKAGLLPTNETLLAIEDAFAEEAGFDPTGSDLLTYPILQPSNLSMDATRTEYCFVSESSDQLELTTTLGPHRGVWRWLVAFMMIGGVAAAVSRLRHRPEVYQNLSRHPHGLALLIGLGWWLLLKPSAVGMLIVLFAVFSLAMRTWRWHRHEKSTSRETPVAMMPS